VCAPATCLVVGDCGACESIRASSIGTRPPAADISPPSSSPPYSSRNCAPHSARFLVAADARVVVPDTVEILIKRNLHEVFGERDAKKRREAIPQLWTEDCVFIDHSGKVRGHDEL